MYTYKCYFHPKSDSTDSCKGCKLPLCASCNGWEGFCKECIEKRRAVHQLKQLRTVAASKAHVAATTTGRLRLAIQEAGPAGNRRGPGPLTPPAPTAPMMHTRPLGGALTPSRALSPSRALPPEPAPQPRRVGMTDVSYKPAINRAPAARQSAAKPRAKTPRPAPKPAASMPAWSMPFLTGLGVGLVVMMVMLFSHGHHHPRPKAKPLYQSLTRQERQIATQLLGKDTPPSIALNGGARDDSAPKVGWSGP